MQNLKKHKKEKKTLFVSTPVLTALVPTSFFQHFSFLFFFAISNFLRDVLIGSQKSKKYKIPKQQKQITTTRKHDAKQEDIKHDDSKQNKTTSRKITIK